MDIQNISITNQFTNELKSHNNVGGSQGANTSTNIEQKMKINPEYVPSISEKAIITAIEEANRKLDGNDRSFEISIHEKTKQIMIKVLDSETNEIIREVPSEKILDMVASMCEAAGLLIDEKA